MLTKQKNYNIIYIKIKHKIFMEVKKMKSYKEYPKKYLGGSDYAALTMVGCKENTGLTSAILHFGEDGIYDAYFVDENAEIGSHYELIATFNYWIKIYDDYNLTTSLSGSTINIYRAGDYGCIIQVIK